MKKYLILFALILIQGCGGGDGATYVPSDPPDVPTDPTTEFQLFATGTFTEGYRTTYDLTGTSTVGDEFTGTISSRTLATSTFLGQDAVPIISQLELTNTVSGAFTSNISTGYYSTSVTDRHFLGFTDSEQTTVSAETSAIPQTAKIDDFGDFGTYTLNTGDVVKQSWRLDDGRNGLAKFVILSTMKDQFNEVKLNTTSTSTIDTSGNSISTQVIYYYPDTGITVTLNTI